MAQITKDGKSRIAFDRNKTLQTASPHSSPCPPLFPKKMSLATLDAEDKA
jgi:hypothetical protein